MESSRPLQAGAPSSGVYPERECADPVYEWPSGLGSPKVNVHVARVITGHLRRAKSLALSLFPVERAE